MVRVGLLLAVNNSVFLTAYALVKCIYLSRDKRSKHDFTTSDMTLGTHKLH